MKIFIQTVCCAGLFVGSTVLASDTNTDDQQIIVEVENAIRSGNFQAAIDKADGIIRRFEENKEISSNYVCTSGGADTLMALMVVASAQAKDPNSVGQDKKDKTSAISSSICDAYFLKGFAQIDLKQRDQALPNFEMALSLDPDNQHYMNELAEWYKAGRQWQKSLEIFTVASETTDLSIEFMKDKNKSERIMNELRCRSYRGIAFNQVEMQQWNAARKALKSCLKLIPNEPKSKAELEYIKANAGG